MNGTLLNVTLIILYPKKYCHKNSPDNQARPSGRTVRQHPEQPTGEFEKCPVGPRRPLHPLPKSLQTPWRIRPATRTVKAV